MSVARSFLKGDIKILKYVDRRKLIKEEGGLRCLFLKSEMNCTFFVCGHILILRIYRCEENPKYFPVELFVCFLWLKYLSKRPYSKKFPCSKKLLVACIVNHHGWLTKEVLWLWTNLNINYDFSHSKLTVVKIIFLPHNT